MAPAIKTEKAKSTKRSISVNEKLIIINEIESGVSQAALCKKLKLNKSTVCNIWKCRDKIKSESSINSQKKKIRASTHPQVDQLLLMWYEEKRASNIPVDGPSLQFMAEEFGKVTGDAFKCSNGWLDRFKKRYNIVLSKKGNSSNNDWTSQIWPALKKDYHEDDIFNADETGLLFRLRPGQTAKFKHEKCSGGRLPGERLSLLVCANASGREKRKLFVIGKLKNPGSFKHVKSIPADYVANSKALMTSSLFENYLLEWDRELVEENRKIVLLIDTSPAHPRIVLNNIKLVFLPVNVSISAHPMQRGIIANLKQIFRKQLLLRFAEMEQNNDSGRVSVLDAINLLSLAWDRVTQETVKNAFHVSGITKLADSLADEDFEPEADSATREWARITAQADFDADLFNDYVNVDSNVISTETLSCKEEFINFDAGEDESDSEEENSIQTAEALKCMRTVKQYFQQEGASESVISTLNNIHSVLDGYYLEKDEVKVQLADYFKHSQ